MAISTILVGRCYRRVPALRRRDQGRRRLREQRPQRRQRAQFGHRMRRTAHRRAECGVEHPNWDFLRASDAVVDKTAAHHPAGRPLDRLMDAHRLPSPRMPSVRHLAIVETRSTVGVLSLSCTIASGCIPRSAISARRSSRNNTPGRRSNQPPDPVHPQGRTPTIGEDLAGIDRAHSSRSTRSPPMPPSPAPSGPPAPSTSSR